jgi:small subunit ribosomal protein S2
MEKKKTETVAVKELIEAGAHFGHTASRWNPKMKRNIFGKKNNIHIIDIKNTLKGILTAYHYLKELARKNGTVLFVGTKRQAQNVVKNEATRAGMPYVSERWLGGTLTNFDTIRLRLNKLIELETLEKDGLLGRFNKKELSAYRRELKKLQINLGGIRNMSRLPQALVAVDYKDSKISINEAKRMKIRTICLVDTDGDPSAIDIPIPINDDAERVIQIVINKLADAVVEGKASAEPVKVTPLKEIKKVDKMGHVKTHVITRAKKPAAKKED